MTSNGSPSSSGTAQSQTPGNTEIGIGRSLIGSDRHTPAPRSKPVTLAARAKEIRASLPCSLTRAMIMGLSQDYSLRRISFNLDMEIPDGDRANAIAYLHSVCQPATNREILEWLAELKLLTRIRNMTDQELGLTFAAMADRLADYPGEIVRFVLKRWPESSKWFPTLNELLEDIRIHNERSMLLEAISAYQPKENTQ